MLRKSMLRKRRSVSRSSSRPTLAYRICSTLQEFMVLLKRMSTSSQYRDASDLGKGRRALSPRGQAGQMGGQRAGPCEDPLAYVGNKGRPKGGWAATPFRNSTLKPAFVKLPDKKEKLKSDVRLSSQDIKKSVHIDTWA